MQNDIPLNVPEGTKPAVRPWWQHLWLWYRNLCRSRRQVILSDVAISPEQYLNSRAVRKIEIYIRLAKMQRFLYRSTSMIVIICSATVPVLLNIGEKYSSSIDIVVWTTMLSLIVTILVSAEKLFRFRDHWRSYEAVAGRLHYELFQYQAMAGDYKKKESAPEEKFRRFVNSFEEIIKAEKGERSGWETQNS